MAVAAAQMTTHRPQVAQAEHRAVQRGKPDLPPPVTLPAGVVAHITRDLLRAGSAVPGKNGMRRTALALAVAAKSALELQEARAGFMAAVGAAGAEQPERRESS